MAVKVANKEHVPLLSFFDDYHARFKSSGVLLIRRGIEKWLIREPHKLEIVGSNPTPAIFFYESA